MNPFTERVVRIIGSIPHGSVMTYGQIAEEAGSPRGARQVVRILHSLSEKYGLPWHRVVNARGEIALQDEAAREHQIGLLLLEDVYVDPAGRIDLDEYRHTPADGKQHTGRGS